MSYIGGQIIVSPTDSVCPENRVNFTCQQSGSTEWDIHLQPQTLMQTAQVTQAVGSVIRFGVDRGFNFELHIVSSSSGNFTTQLQVTAVRELDNVTVGCRGQSGTFLSTIQVASVGELNLSLATNVVLNFNKDLACSCSKWSHGNR